MWVRRLAPKRSFIPAACALVLSGCVVVSVPKPSFTIGAADRNRDREPWPSELPPKQILAGTVSLELAGDVVTGQIALEGADFVGGARPLNRYLATISSR